MFVPRFEKVEMMNEADWRRRYLERLASPEWKELKRRLIDRNGGGCERCYLITNELELHHRTYERLGHERDEDLEVLCERCHKIADAERKQKTDQAFFDARIDGWASKKYGEDWRDSYNAEAIEEEFYDWIDSRE